MRLGAASVWLSEHHFFEDGYLPQPLTFAAAIAARTTRIRIGTAVLLAALRHPAQLAEEAAIVDILSNGRLDLGVGLGYRVPEYEGFGRTFDRRFAQTEAVLREVIRLWDDRRRHPRARAATACRSGVASSVPVARVSPVNSARACSRSTPTLMEPYRAGLGAGGHDPASRRGSRRCATSCSPTTPKPCGRSSGPTSRTSGTRTTATPSRAPARPHRARSTPTAGARRARTVRRPASACSRPSRPRRTSARSPTACPRCRCTCGRASPGMPDDLVDRHVELASTELRDRLAPDATVGAAAARRGMRRRRAASRGSSRTPRPSATMILEARRCGG